MDFLKLYTTSTTATRLEITLIVCVELSQVKQTPIPPPQKKYEKAGHNIFHETEQRI